MKLNWISVRVLDLDLPTTWSNLNFVSKRAPLALRVETTASAGRTTSIPERNYLIAQAARLSTDRQQEQALSRRCAESGLVNGQFQEDCKSMSGGWEGSKAAL